MKRRAEFMKVEENKPVSENFDQYIDFLMQLQTIFGPFEISREPTVMKINKIL